MLGLDVVSIGGWADYAAPVEGEGVVEEGLDAAVDLGQGPWGGDVDIRGF